MKLFEYNSNNSGGDWWLKDHDWYAMEKAGWKIEWVKDMESVLGFEKGDRWLGTLAMSAEKEFKSLDDAISDFESITGQDYYDEGCECCGRPHYIGEK